MALKPLIFLSVFSSLFLLSSQTCKNYKFTQNRVFKSCTNLPYLEAQVHWTYNPTQIEIAFIAPQSPTGWIAWGINPTQTGMPGSEALVAFHHSSKNLIVYPTQITSYSPSMIPGSLTFPVMNISAEYRNNEMIIFAVVEPLLGNESRVYHIWQTGGSVSGDIPVMHSTSGSHLRSFGSLDFLTGE